jgi:uncharacterized protein (TIGR03435 family)
MRLLILTCFFGLMTVLAQDTPTAPVSPAAFGQRIEGIEFRGLRRVPQDTMRAALHSKVGGILSQELLRQDFQALWNSKRFDDIQVKTETDPNGGLVVVFIVKEIPGSLKSEASMEFRLIAFALMVTAGLGQSQDVVSSARLEFEVASIRADPRIDVSIGKPPGGRLVARGIIIRFLIALAYDVKDFQVIGGPSWIGREQYSIDAKPGDSPKGPILSLYLTQRQKEDEEFHLRIQSLLADRFQLKIHKETREEQVYSLVVVKNGPKFKESKFDDSAPKGLPGLTMHPYDLIGTKVSLHYLAEELSRRLGRNVIDQTGLDGEYNFNLRWAPDVADGDSVADGPSIFTALQEQMGLKLESSKVVPVKVLVIDQVERPSAN